MRTVGVIGAGQMGSGIAQTVAQHGIKVLLADVNLEVAEKAKTGIDLTLAKLVAREKITVEEAEAILARIIPIAEFHARGVEDVMQEAREIVGQGESYVTYDIDFVDPTFAPGTGTPEPGGLTAHLHEDWPVMERDRKSVV